MIYLEEKASNTSVLIENQFPKFVQENNPAFLKFLSSYYESQETKYHPLDIVSNLIDYYNISYYRPNRLIESTVLTGNVLVSNTSINVFSTVGYPEENGYIQINNEIIFYRSKTNTSFNDCVRGTSALILENIPSSKVVLKNSTKSEHRIGGRVINIAFAYANEFFERIKSELAPLLPEVLDESLDVSSFIKNIKSFYSSKGSLNSHRILFKILFNDKKFNIKLKFRGSGAKLKINNFNGFIPINPKPEIVNGGFGYDKRKDSSNNLINPPIIDIFGSGIGSVSSTGTRPNTSAILEVTDIDSNGSIVDINVLDPGEGYRGPITARVRPKNFIQDQRIYNQSGTGTGRVEYFDAFTNELILYDVIGYFNPNEELFANDGEKAKAFIAQSFANPVLSRSGLEVLSEDQQIEFPREYTFKTSDSSYNQKKIIRCKLLDEYSLVNDIIPVATTLKQDSDKLFGVTGVNIEVDSYISLFDDIFEFEISSNSDIGDIYLPPTTSITKQLTSISSNTTNLVITVDDASRFPIVGGIILVNGKEINYKTRSANQFFECIYKGSGNFDLNIKDEVISFGRIKYDVEWSSSEIIKIGDYRFYEDNLYLAQSNGISGSTAPTHLFGAEYDGSLSLGDLEPVQWQYFGENKYNYSFYIEYNNALIENPRFQILGAPGDIIIQSGGSLHSESKYEFARFDSPNINVYNFTDGEISDRLSAILGTNYNKNRLTVDDSRFPSNKSLTGFLNTYDYEDYIYVASSGIPSWWNNIVDLSQQSLNTEDQKKISFTNQKLVCRWKKSSLLYDTQSISTNRKTKKLLGLNIDAIQVNSCKGNTVEFGKINKFFIGHGGNYPVSYLEDSNGYGYAANYDKNPEFILNDSVVVDNTSNLTKISASIDKINFDTLELLWDDTQKLRGFTTKPKLVVINNNPKISLNFTSFVGINETTNIITHASHGLSTTDKVKFTVNSNYFSKLKTNTEYFVRRINDNEFTLHRTKTDCLLNANIISLKYITISSPQFSFETDQLNPENYRPAQLEISYINGSIDNIVIRDSGSGYIQLPTIRIIDGGKIDYIDIPYSVNGTRIINSSGPLVSYTNFYKNNFNEIDDFIAIQNSFEIAPKVKVNSGSGAEALVYTSNGVIVSVVLIKPGNSYLIPPELIITGTGKDAVIESIINSFGEVVGFDIINGGSGYSVTPRVDIIPVGNNASISSKLNEWTFNLVRQLNKYNRIDSYGGYVFDAEDSQPSLHNPNNFRLINYELDFPKDLDKKQYYILQNSNKLLAKYIDEKNPSQVNQLKTTISQSEPTRDFGTNPLTESELFSMDVHSPVITIAYDGIPVYGGQKVFSIRNNSSSSLSEIKSRYKLKYIEVVSGTAGAISVSTTSGIKYVTLQRSGGPNVINYPIGSFIEDYEYVEGLDNDLDEHNGRFTITPEFPTGRYCYFTTSSSFDPITNALVNSSAAGNSNINFAGFPYFIGDTFASEYDDYMNGRCRTNDKIPKDFVRSFEKDVSPIITNGITIFPGLTRNDEYPQENTDIIKTIAGTNDVYPGTVDSVIIESKGNGYRVGDKLDVDNTRTFGAGFSAFVSKVGGKSLLSITKTQNLKKVTFQTNQNHQLKIGDYVYFDYLNPQNPINVFLQGNILSQLESARVQILNNFELMIGDDQPVSFYSNKRIYSINLNFKYTYKLNIPINTPYKITYDIDKINEFFILDQSSSPDSIILDCTKIPNKLYLHIGDYIYEINKTTDYYGPQKISDVTDETFIINFRESTAGYEEFNLFYNAKSYGAVGPIEEISISNSGFNYRKLPIISGIIKKGTTNEVAGDGKAIIQTNSSTIGTIKTVTYSSIGESFTSNNNVNYYLNIPATAKVINNFEIYEVEIIDGGQEYDNVVEILVNGSNSIARLKATVNIGTITNIEVIEGGFNFIEIPTLTIVSQQGYGCELKAKIRRKQLFPGNKLYGNINSQLFPVQIKTTIVAFDADTSTLEFDEEVGQFKNNDTLYTIDGNPYGKIVSIRRSRAYAKISPYANLESVRSDITGNLSETLQKITDSNYYQDWSYSLVSSRDTKEWKKDQDINTHPAGFRQFGKKIIERRKFFFDNPADVFKSSVIFTTNIVDNILLKVKLSPCKTQKIFLQDSSLFNIGDYIYGTASGAIGEVVSRSEYFISLKIRNNILFILNEIVVKISPEFAFGLLSGTSKTMAFWNGIFQEPEESYEVSVSDPIYTGMPDSFIPKFEVSVLDELSTYTLETDFDILDTQTLTPNQTIFSLSLDGTGYSVNTNNLEQFIISIGGSVQNPNNLTVTDNIISTNEIVNYSSKVVAIRHPQLKKLTFTGAESSYTINYTPIDECNLLIFNSSVFQSSVFTDYTVSGNIITFSEPVNINNIFGWYIDEIVECEVVDVDILNRNRVLSIVGCTTKNFTKFIESNAIKTPASLYEIRKELIDGTVYPVDSTSIHGFDTKFSYTSPRYSSSYVEVLDRILFNGSLTFFTMKVNGENYIPSNGRESVLVYINNSVLDQDLYSISGSVITFNQTYSAAQSCTIIDFKSQFLSNTNNENGSILDRLNVVQNGNRSIFNLSDRGVPKYVNNIADLFVIKNGLLKIPAPSYTDHRNIQLSSHSVSDNKITFVQSPISSDNNKITFFNRQLLPEPSKNVILDRLRCFDGIRTIFPITVDGILFSPVTVNHLFIVRNGVMQKPGIDYNIVNQHNVIFSDAPENWEIIFSFYSFDGLTQNIPLNFAKYFDGVQTEFALTQNYQSTSVNTNHNILVFRNGVYQYPSDDYIVTDHQTSPYITFATAPQVSDEIFVTNITQPLVDATSYFSQILSNQIQSSAPNGTYDDSVFLIFINGLLQAGTSWTYASNTITFNATVSLTLDKVKIYAFTSVRRKLDSILITNTSTLTYDLDHNSIQVNNVSKASDLIVSLEGVVQEPDVAYTVTSNSITFNDSSLYEAGVEVYIYQVGNSSSNLTEKIDYLNDNFTKFTEVVGGVSIDTNRYKLANIFQSFNPPNSDDVFIIRNGVVQNPTEDFVVGNGFIDFSSNISVDDDIFILYTHGSTELSIVSSSDVSSSIRKYTLSTTLSSNEYNNIILFADGAPRFYQRGDFTVENNGTELHLSHTELITPTQVFVIKYPSVTLIDEYEDCPNGIRTRFKLIYNNQNLIIGNIASDADILISINGIVQHPGNQYTLTSNRRFVDMSYAPQYTDEIFMIRMNGNLVRNLTPAGVTNQYTISVPETNEKENIVVFSNQTWKFAELGDFTWNNDNTVTLSSAHTTGNLFAIKFYGVFNLLDQIHTPYNGINTKFNLFDIQENFVPVGTVVNDNIPDETSILVAKNGKILDPKVDYTLSGDIKSQLLFSSAPISIDVISVRSVGSFDKLDTIIGGSGTQFNVTKSGVDYYANSHIDRPRELENQIMVLSDGNPLSPLYDYYIDNNKIIFTNQILFQKLVLLDFRGTQNDVQVYNRFNQISVGDELTIPSETSTRKITQVLSPTVIKTEQYTGVGPRNFSATSTYIDGKITNISVINSGLGYQNPVVLRSKGTGTGPKAVATVNNYLGGSVVPSTIEIQYPGSNIYANQEVLATVYASIYKKQPLNKSQIRKGTKLTSNINNIVEIIPLANTFELPSNTPTISVSSSSGSGAQFKLYISKGELRKIEILDGGSGYDDRDMTVQLIGGGGTGCVIEPKLSNTGSITNMIIRNPGVGYDTFRVIIHSTDQNNIVNAEVIEYTHVSQSGIDGCTRGVLGDAVSHSENTIVYFDSYL